MLPLATDAQDLPSPIGRSKLLWVLDLHIHIQLLHTVSQWCSASGALHVMHSTDVTKPFIDRKS